MSGCISLCWIGTRQPNPTPPLALIDAAAAVAAGWTAPPEAGGALKELGLVVVEQLTTGAGGALTGGCGAGFAGADGVGSAPAKGECGK